MLSSRRDEAKAKETSDVIIDRLNNKRYLKGRFLGKGGFAKCYELTDIETRQVYAGKIVPKSMLVKQHHRDKLIQEIKIHKSVNHAHIVGFYGYVEDDENVYILLELCRRRSLMELHKRRHTITEPECRYFVHQIALACHYLHKLQIIHRDLKLGNLFLNDELEIKIGDFGLATKLDYEGERKKTLCGTPNYIAPEILSKKGHSYEVDSWSLGCIVYTLLVGKPPFETPSLKDTYIRISRNEYHLPSSLSRAARHFIRQLLHPEPSLRPNMEQVLGHEFLTLGFMPLCLPTSCLTMPPHFDILRLAKMERKGSVEEESPETASPPCSTGPVEVQAVAGDNGEYVTEQMRQPSPGGNNDDDDYNDDEKAQPTAAGGAVTTASGQRCDYHLSDLYSQLTKVIESQAPSFDAVNDVLSDDAEDPAAVPIYWISKWVDYSDKYGLGYQLSDNSIGVLFNDSTRLLLNRNMQNIQYIERDGIEHFHTLKSFPETLTKKVTLLKYFRNYMQEHLLKAGADIEPRCSDEMTRLPFLRTWFRTRSAIVLHLNNGTLQINFFQDHTKIILCPLMGAVTYIDECRDSRTYRLQLICEFGCCKQLASRLRYAFAMVQRLLAAKSYRPRSTASAAPIATNAAAAAAATAADY